MKRWKLRRFFARTPVVLLVASVSVLAVVALSPYLLQRLAPPMGGDWNDLSDIGQTYAAVAAILSALAVAGVAVSLVIQSRQARVEQWQTVRGFQKDLLLMALDNPIYRDAWGEKGELTGEEWQKHTYTRMVLHYMWLGADTGAIPWGSLPRIAANTFRVESNVRVWARMRQGWLVEAQTAREREFVAIFDTEYQAALRRAPAPVPE
ncbi:DUF6082 family protein [Streptomyces sp. NPDC006393]|uniref:DUF6082 family protein n=1 Tax=Streptomyces sp. NPDC006393 TaxID=3156763 RepID=UPI003407BEE7